MKGEIAMTKKEKEGIVRAAWNKYKELRPVNENMTEKFKELCERVAKLKLLLDDPQPGMASWCQLYAEHMKFISDYWTQN